jgi:hypothetical protein
MRIGWPEASTEIRTIWLDERCPGKRVSVKAGEAGTGGVARTEKDGEGKAVGWTVAWAGAATMAHAVAASAAALIQILIAAGS